MTTPWWSDDDRFFAAVMEAYQASQEVPPEVVAAGKALFTWRDVDAELAALTYDSALEGDLTSSVRVAEPAALRALMFATPELSVELAMEPAALVGQLDPPCAGTAEALLVTGDVVRTPIDEDGCFVFRPVPSEGFRLWCRPASRTGMVTGWIMV